MFHKIKSVSPRPELILSVEFQDGSVKNYDVKPLLKKWPAFQIFEYVPELFEQVHVDAGGYGISWNDDIDLSCEELYFNGKILINNGLQSISNKHKSFYAESDKIIHY